jgi:hypothetical protein
MSDSTPALVSSRAIPPLREAVRLIWRDTGRALNVLFNVFLIAAAVNIVGDVISFMAVRDRGEEAGDTLVIAVLIGAVQALFLTPYIVAIHRFIVLDEIAPSYRANFGGERFMRFYGWTLALTACFVIPLLLTRALPLGDDVRAVFTAAIGIIVLIFALRVVIIFPAIAVDAPGATLVNAIADTKGFALRIFLLGLLVIVPFVVAIIVVAIVFGLLVGFEDRETIASTFVGSIVEAVSLTAFVVMASRIFGWLGNRLRHT